MALLGTLSFFIGIICVFGFIFSKKKVWSQILVASGVLMLITSFNAPATLIMSILFILLGLYGAKIIDVNYPSFLNNSRKSRVIMTIISIVIVGLVATFSQQPNVSYPYHTTTSANTRKKRVYSVKHVKISVSKRAGHDSDWVVKGQTDAPDGAKIVAVVLDNSDSPLENVPVSESDNIGWSKVKNGKFSTYIDPLDVMDTNNCHAGDTASVHIVALTNYHKVHSHYDDLSKTIRQQIKKTNPYKFELTSSQVDYLNSLDDSDDSSSDSSSSNSESTNSEDSDTNENSALDDDSSRTNAEDEPSSSSTKPTKTSSENTAALEKAEDYATEMDMSKQAVYDQLTSDNGEGFTTDEANYAMDHLTGVDWNQNALKKAKSYQKEQSMSTSAIREQLTSDAGEQFTATEADYAINHLND